jgi:hypothetical protein
VTIRILADREPYTVFDGGPRPAGELDLDEAGPFGPVRILNGPGGLDEPPPDVIVLPAEAFLSLRRPAPRDRGETPLYIPFGPVGPMRNCFEKGCADYIREPWSLPELLARLSRLMILRFRIRERALELRGALLAGGVSPIELSKNEEGVLRSLVINAPLPIPRGEDRALGRCVISLRRKMDSIEPGLGRGILTIRAFGYRLDGSACV